MACNYNCFIIFLCSLSIINLGSIESLILYILSLKKTSAWLTLKCSNAKVHLLQVYSSDLQTTQKQNRAEPIDIANVRWVTMLHISTSQGMQDFVLQYHYASIIANKRKPHLYFLFLSRCLWFFLFQTVSISLWINLQMLPKHVTIWSHNEELPLPPKKSVHTTTRPNCYFSCVFFSGFDSAP